MPTRPPTRPTRRASASVRAFRLISADGSFGIRTAAIGLARRARRLVIVNLVVAGTFIAVLVAWDLVGTLPLPLGVAGHGGSTIIVGLNGLRLLGQRRLASRRQSARRILNDRIDRCPVGVLA